MIVGISRRAVKALSYIITAVKGSVVCAGRILYTRCNFIFKTYIPLCLDEIKLKIYYSGSSRYRKGKAVSRGGMSSYQGIATMQ